MSNEDEMMRLAALKNAQSIFLARQRAERELVEAREALERKTEELREAEWRMRIALEVGNGGAWVLEIGPKTMAGDAMVARSFNVPIARCRAGEPVGSFLAAIHEEDRERVKEALEYSVQTGGPFRAEYRTVGAGGVQRWLDARGRVEMGTSGAPERVVGVVLDTTNRKAVEAQLVAAKERAEAASRAKDNFLAALSHELRTPLTPVLMTAAALHEDERLPEDVRDQLGMMERNISIEARLIDDLLDLTRVTQGKMPLQLQVCDAHSLIALATEIVRDEAQAKGIVIEQSFQAARSGLMADPARFQQVIWNLLRNAVKYTPNGGHVAIRTADMPKGDGTQGLRIDVRDTGIGIETEYLERIFQAFEQGGLPGEHQFGGLGLGLSIARAIVDLHGGEIRAESAGKGHGATFIIEFPEALETPRGLMEPAHEAGDSAGEADCDEETQRTLRLLIVEDHRATLDVLKRLLTRDGHYVVGAGTVSAALAAAGETDFDVVISDLGLPDGTGIELMEKLRAHHGLRGIALSGYGMEKDTERTREAGFMAHLIKPIDFNQLRHTLESLE
jgi:signal transduction histidine kinase